ncbi:hypothetical protein [Brevundimonas sp. Marseille-Q4549]
MSVRTYTAGRFRIDLNLATPQTWIADPGAGDIRAAEASASGIQARQAGQPIGGIVVKGGKNPGGSLRNLVQTADGYALPSNPQPGLYDFVIEIPRTALPADTLGAGRNGLRVTFSLEATADGYRLASTGRARNIAPRLSAY